MIVNLFVSANIIGRLLCSVHSRGQRLEVLNEGTDNQVFRGVEALELTAVITTIVKNSQKVNENETKLEQHSIDQYSVLRTKTAKSGHLRWLSKLGSNPMIGEHSMGESKQRGSVCNFSVESSN